MVMKILGFFCSMQFFIAIAGARPWHPQISYSDNRVPIIVGFIHATSENALSIVITATGTTTTLGCNPDATTIEAALGTATASGDCGAVTLSVSDGQVISSGCNRSQTRTWTATDACGNSASASRTVTWVVNTSTPLGTISGTNPNLGCNPSDAAINAALGTATANTTCGSVQLTVSDGPIQSSGCNHSQTRSWTATDDCGNFATATRTATWIVDTIPPEIGSAPDIVQIADPGLASASLNIVTPTVTDNCGTVQATVTRSDNLSLTAPYPVGTTIITWTATDACGNTRIRFQTVTITDVEAPAIISCPNLPPQCYDANSMYAVPVLTASDNSGTPMISYVITGASSRQGNTGDASGFFNPGISIIEWTVRDLNGNTANCTTSVVIDKIDASIPDAYAADITPDIGSPNTIYIGYGGASITLGANITSSVNSDLYSYKWTIGSPGGSIIGTGPTVTVSPATTTTYYLSIKDQYNCKQQTQVFKQITVNDIRCGTDKVSICEMSKNGTMKTVCTSISKITSAPAGSYLGQCPAPMTRSGMNENPGPAGEFRIKSLPGPASATFSLQIMNRKK